MSTIFISHAASDAELGQHLKDQLESRLNGSSVFLSSDPTDLPPGIDWSSEVQRALRDTQAIILLTTTRSLSRPWVWFEIGTAWFRDGVPVIPLCLGEIHKGALPPPLGQRQAVNGYEVHDLKSVFITLARTLGFQLDDQDFQTVCNELVRIDGELQKKLTSPDGWIGASWEGKFLAVDGPFERLQLIENDVFVGSMRDALEAAGFKVFLAALERLQNAREKGARTVHLTDRQSWRRQIRMNELVLVARKV